MSLRKPSERVRNTGDADARSGGIAVSGRVDNLTVNAGSRVRSSYLERVRLIAPEELLDRELEWRELELFCTAADPAPSYMWWRAPAWAGKSALMASFVLRPPAGVRVVSFFITARWAGQDNRVAFAEVVIEQLAELLDESLPPLLTEATREAHLLGMLSSAAQRCHSRGERLVLVVDGLDEDRGVTSSNDAHSIAALLPPAPAMGMRVVVAGRLNPPIPTDVALSHPLRDPKNAKVLARSPHALDVRHHAQRELKRLLGGSETERDLLGLLAAAGGGLSGHDLAELTGGVGYEIEDLLSSVAARTFTPRTGHWRPKTVYVLGHEELQQHTVERLGAERLEAYRQRLHAWADSYRDRDWPESTPEYLLRGYFSLLLATGATSRMVAFATDKKRHRRMLAITGGDAAALTEITSTQDQILTQPEPDLYAMARLSMHRRDLIVRNARIPFGLPALWAVLGQPARAEALARSIDVPSHRAEALAEVAKALADAGDLDRAARLIADAEQLASGITEPYWKLQTLSKVHAVAVVAAGDVDRAEEIVRGLSVSASGRSSALVEVAKAAVVTSDLDRVRRLIADAEGIARSITDLGGRGSALAEVAEAAAVAGDLHWAGRLIADAERIARSITDLGGRGSALAEVAEAAAVAGDLHWAGRLAADAERIARSITNILEQSRVLNQVVVAVAAAGDHVQAEQIALSILNPANQLHALAKVVAAVVIAGDPQHAEQIARNDPDDPSLLLLEVAKAMADVGDLERAGQLAADAEQIARSTDWDFRVIMLTEVALALVTAGDHAWAGRLAADAEQTARSITNPRFRMGALTLAAKAAVAVGDLERASRLASDQEQIARDFADLGYRAMALAWAAEAIVAIGDFEWASRLAADAEQVARSITDQVEQSTAMAVVAEVVAVAGNPNRAEQIAGDITVWSFRVEALTEVAKAVVAAGDLQRASRLAADAKQIARNIIEERHQSAAMARVVEVVALAGNPNWAEQIARDIITDSIDDWGHKAAALTEVAKAVVAAGDLQRASRLAADAEQIARNIIEERGQSAAMARVAEVVALAGNPNWAEQIARDITDSDECVRSLTAIAKVVGLPRAGHLVGSAFALGSWLVPLPLLAVQQPELVLQIAGELEEALSV